MRSRFSLPAAAAALALVAGAPCAAAPSAGPWRLTLETGAVWQARNDEQIPGDGGTGFSMSRLQGGGPWAHMRVTLEGDVDRRAGWRFMASPLEIEATGTLDRPVHFAGADFATGTPTTGAYRFNSYRATYRYRFHRDARSEWRAGVTLKIRHARVALRQGDLAAASNDLGVVPLIHVAGRCALGPRTTFVVDFDGLAAPMGRAFDLGLAIAQEVAPGWSALLGYRTLEGGAANNRVYTFAWLNYLTVGVALRF